MPRKTIAKRDGGEPSIPSLWGQVHERHPHSMVQNSRRASGPHVRNTNRNNCRVASTTDASFVQRITPLETRFRETQRELALSQPHRKTRALERAIRNHNARVRGGVK
jgi:hypothetical protein